MTIRTIFAAVLFATLSTALVHAQDAKAQDAAASFAAMLTNATLNGTWAPIDKKALGIDEDDKYHIVKATKAAGNQWLLLTRMKMQGREVQFPIPVVVEFAGDAAVMILNNVPIGPGQTWSARVLFHDDVYAGSWWGADKAVKSGIVSGTITRGDQDKPKAE